jgi:lipopolysaccharide heptosyltransferase II
MMPWSEARNILCVRLDSMGDVLMSTPAIRAIKESARDRRVTVLTSPGGAAAAALVPEIDEVLAFEAPWMKAGGPHGRAADRADDRAMIRTLASERFDAAVIFTVYSQSPLPAAYMCYLAGIPLRLAHCRENPYDLLTHWVRDPEPESLVRHEARRQLDLVATAGCMTPNERLSFNVLPGAKARVAQTLEELGVGEGRTLIVAHPGASAASRRYPPENFARALDLLLDGVDAELILTGDAAEGALISGIRAAMRRPARSLAGRLGLAELGALLARSDLLVSNNTGPVHVAAAVGTPVVDIYALTNPQHAPWMVEHRVLFHDVPCRYCYRSACPAGHHACLRKISPREIAGAALELLSGGGAARALPPPRKSPIPIQALSATLAATPS